MVAQGGSSERRRARRVRVVRWITDRDGQRVEAWRVPKGECALCSRIAYREEPVGSDLRLVCERHRARVLRTGEPSVNYRRGLRGVDIAFGQRLLLRDPTLSAPALAEEINAFRAQADLEPISARSVLRRVIHGTPYGTYEE